MNNYKSSPLAKRFQKRMLGFILVLILIMLTGGMMMSEYILAKNLHQNAEAMNDLVQLQMDWINLNASASIETPVPEGEAVEEAPHSGGEHIPQMIVEEWGKKSTLGQDTKFGLVSQRPLIEEKRAKGKADVFLTEMEQGKADISKRWWKEGDTYYLLSPLVIKDSCNDCHESDSGSKIRGAFLWEFGTSSISQFRMMGILSSTIMVLGSVFILYFLFKRFFSQAITKPLGELEDLADQISRGNFDLTFNYQFEDEIKKVGESIFRLKKSLQMAMKRLGAKKD